MAKSKIAYQGHTGAYSHMACDALYPNLEQVACGSFREVFELVENEQVKCGIVPIENSTAGRVVDVHRLLKETNLHIIREYFLPVHHCLMAPEGATKTSIKKVYSHVQALMQCDKHIRDAGYAMKEYGDTAGAAAMVALEADVTKGAIASKLAAEEYGLTVIEPDFQDISSNATRFVVVSKDPIEHSYDQGHYITTIMFSVKNIPSALYKVLGGFATNNINVLKLESYLRTGGFNSADFYVDIEAHVDEKRMINAMEEVEFFAKDIRVMGCYPAHKFRKRSA